MGRKKLTLHFPEADDPIKIRRLTEACTLDKKIEVEVCMKGRFRNWRAASRHGAAGS